MPVQCLHLKKVVTNVFVIGSMAVIGLIVPPVTVAWSGEEDKCKKVQIVGPQMNLNERFEI